MASGRRTAGGAGGLVGGAAHAIARAANKLDATRPFALVIGVALGAAPAVANRAWQGGLGRVVGEARSEFVVAGETLLDIAFRNGVGFEAISRLNPGVDPWIPDPGTVVHVPSRTIVPWGPAEGLVINVPEMRLFDFRGEDGPQIIAAAVGDAEDPTPVGDFEVRDKRVDPVWTVPESIRVEKPHLPERVPPGPDNPLGSRWMRIGETACGIHGTNARWSIGRAATHGCVRLYEAEIVQLFERTPEGTRLQVIYQPYKWGRDGAAILFEAHPDRYHRVADPLASALTPIRELGLLGNVDVDRVWRAIDESRGVPIRVGTLPATETP